MHMLKVKRLRNGLGPNEAIVGIKTVSGRVEAVVDTRSIKNGAINIGFPVGWDERGWLVELPVELADGSRRVFVPSSELSPPPKLKTPPPNALS